MSRIQEDATPRSPSSHPGRSPSSGKLLGAGLREVRGSVKGRGTGRENSIERRGKPITDLVLHASSSYKGLTAVDAIPCDLAMGLGGAPGQSSKQDVANAAELTGGRLTRPGSTPVESWVATKVTCRALDPRPAQGRVGESPRHVCTSPARHPLLLVTATDRPARRFGHRVQVTRGPLTPGSRSVSRRMAWTSVSPPQTGSARSRVGSLARPETARAHALALEPSRGKGVHAA